MNTANIEQVLESDDELPSYYNEDPEPPAYVNDLRFNNIVFKWINNNENEAINTTEDNLNSDPQVKNYISKGYLSHQDLFCLQSISDTTSDCTFLWFVDFLVRKDLHLRYGSNLKSCLVNKYPCYVDVSPKEENVRHRKKYKIVVKI